MTYTCGDCALWQKGPECPDYPEVMRPDMPSFSKFTVKTEAAPAPTPTPAAPDLINSPPHYKGLKYEVIEVIHALGLTTDYAFGNALKYLLRYHKKGTPTVDVQKARWYIDWLIEHFKGRQGRQIELAEALQEVILSFGMPDEEIQQAAYNVALPAWFGDPKNLAVAKLCVDRWLEAHAEINMQTSQALAKLKAAGIEPTMTADEVLKLTRE